MWTGGLATLSTGATRGVTGQLRRSCPFSPQEPHLRSFLDALSIGGGGRFGDDMVVEKCRFDVGRRL